MKYYIVEAPHYDWDKLFIIKANNKKEAIDIVFDAHFSWRNTPQLKQKGYSFFRKSDFIATDLENKFKENSIVCLL